MTKRRRVIIRETDTDMVSKAAHRRVADVTDHVESAHTAVEQGHPDEAREHLNKVLDLLEAA